MGTFISDANATLPGPFADKYTPDPNGDPLKQNRSSHMNALRQALLDCKSDLMPKAGGTFTGAIAGSPLALVGGVVDGASSVAVTLDTANTLSTTAQLLSLRNKGTPVAYVRQDGAVAGSLFRPVAAADTLKLWGTAADGATALGVQIGNSVNLTTAGAKIASFVDYNGNSKASVDKDGVITGSRLVGAGTSTSWGNTANGPGALSVTMGTSVSATWLVTGNSNGTFRAGIQSLDSDGTLRFYAGTNYFQFTGNTFSMPTTIGLSSSVADGSSAVAAVITSSNAFSTSGAKLLSLKNSTTEKACVDKDGNAALGGIAPTGAVLDLLGVGAQHPGPAYVQLKVHDSAALAANIGGAIAFAGKYTGTGTFANFAAIKGGKVNATDGNLDGYLTFYTRQGNLNGANLTEQMRIDSAGGVTIAALGTGALYTNAGKLTNTNPSDERLKANVATLGYGLAEITALRPVTFDWANDTARQGTRYGFIAQEVASVMPDLVRPLDPEDTSESPLLGLESDGILAALVNAVKELTTRIAALEGAH